MIPGDAFRVKVIRLAQRMGWDPEKSTAEFYEISERGPAALEFVEARVAELESELRTVRGQFGADEKPDEHEVVEVYDQTRCSGMRPGGWTGWPAHAVSDWHLWRPLYRTPDGVNERSEEIRTERGAIELEFNGFYMLPDQSGYGGKNG